MVLKVKLFSLSTCILLSVGFSHCVRLPMRPLRCQELCAGCNVEEVLAKSTCNCTLEQQHPLKDSSCLGNSRKLGTSIDEKSTVRRKRCTPEELYQLRVRIEETKRNIERLRHRNKLPGANLYPVYYSRQANSGPSYMNPIFKPLDSTKDALRPLGHFEDAGNPRPWQRDAPREEPLRPWRRVAGEGRDKGQDTRDINDSVAPRRHVQRAPMSVPETTTSDPVEFLLNRRQLLEENLKMLLKNVDNVSSRNSRPKDESKLPVISIVDLNKLPREIDNGFSFDNDNFTANATTKVGEIAPTAQFHRRNDIVSSSNVNKTLSLQLNDLSDTPHVYPSNPLKNVTRSNQTRPLGSLVATKLSNLVESTTVISKTDPERPAKNDSTRKRLDVIVDIAVMPNARGDTDKRVSEQGDSHAESEEERRKESFVSQHTPHTLSPPIVLDLNLGYRISRDHEVESDEVGGDESEHKDRVPSVSNVFLLKTFKSENANFGIPKAQDLYLFKKGSRHS